MMKKVCIIAVSLGKGGLERSCANLSQLLSDNGYDVHLVILNDDIDYEYSGQLFNLGKHKAEEDSLIKRLLRFRKLRAYFCKQKFDYIIDNRIGNQPWRELYYMFYIYGLRQKVVYMQHSGRLESHMPIPSSMTRLIVNYAVAFIGVSKGVTEDFNQKYNTKKCSTIYNFLQPLERNSIEIDLPQEYILYLGRLDEKTKNFSLMFEAFKGISLPKGVKLVIMGEGPDKQLMENMIDSLGICEDVLFLPYSSNIYAPLSKAKFLILTSRHEGFPMVLIEALSVGTPVVSVDCHSGPSEIIQNEVNGLLIENYNVQALSTAMERMVNDEALYLHCKKNAKQSIQHLLPNEIIKYWKKLLI